MVRQFVLRAAALFLCLGTTSASNMASATVHKVYFGEGQSCSAQLEGYDCPIWDNILPGSQGAPGHSGSSNWAYGNHIFKPFSYKLELTTGKTYEVRLGFAEIWSPNCATGKRRFNVAVGDQTELDVDVFTRAGGCNKAYDLTFSNVVPNTVGEVLVTLTAGAIEQPYLAVLEVVEASYSLIPNGSGKKCPDDDTRLIDAAASSEEACYELCYNQAGCRMFAFSNSSNLCTGCIEGANLDDPSASDTMNLFGGVFEMGALQDFDHELRSVNKKCPYAGNKRIGMPYDAATREICRDRCAANSACVSFTYFDSGRFQSSSYQKWCALCNSLDEDYHEGFNTYTLTATAPVTPAPIDPTPAPVDPTPAPVDPTPAPVDPTPAPVDPTPAPTTLPPTNPPTPIPTAAPTNPPTPPPVTPAPTNSPTLPPTNPPTNPPTDPPTNPPTPVPTAAPTNPPTPAPVTPAPTNPPTSPPTNPPTNPTPDPPTNPPRYALIPNGSGKKCPDDDTRLIDAAASSEEACYEQCYNQPGCAMFAFSNSLNKCTGCIEGANFDDPSASDTMNLFGGVFEMVALQVFDHDLRSVNKKCPYAGNKRIGKPYDAATREICRDRCAANSACVSFTYSNQKWCALCNSLDEDYHEGFNTYTLTATAPVTPAPTNPPTSPPTNPPTNPTPDPPTNPPTPSPTASPTNPPSLYPSEAPSDKPSLVASGLPSADPTSIPTSLPSILPSAMLIMPSAVASGFPSADPTFAPTSLPSLSPSAVPSELPSNAPGATIHKVYFGEGQSCNSQLEGYDCPIWENILPGSRGAPGHSGSSIWAYGNHMFKPFSYKLGLTTGKTYEVRLGFAETWSPNCATGKRRFNVAVGDQTELDVDVFTRAGGCNKAYDLTFSNVEPNTFGEVLVTLTAGAIEQPYLAVLEVVEASTDMDPSSSFVPTMSVSPSVVPSLSPSVVPSELTIVPTTAPSDVPSTSMAPSNLLHDPSSAPSNAPSTSMVPSIPRPPTSAIRINVGGGPFIDSETGYQWLGDTYHNHPTIDDTSTTSNPISGTTTSLQQLYQTDRFDRSSDPALKYEIPDIENGWYDVRLHFAETWEGAFSVSARVFGVKVQQVEIEDVDVFSEVGANTALIRFITVLVSNNALTVELLRGPKENPMISGIEVMSGDPVPTAAPTTRLDGVINGLLHDDPFVRNDFKHVFTEEPEISELGAEIHQRYMDATGDTDLRVRLMRAFERVSPGNPIIPGSLAALLDGLDDPESSVRWQSMRTLSFLEKEANMYAGKSNYFSNNPTLTALVSTAVQEILQNDPSISCRAEAVQCLGELRLVPEVILDTLNDSEPQVRANAVRALCHFSRATIYSAINKLTELVSDPICGADATATLQYCIYDDTGSDRKKYALLLQSRKGSPSSLTDASARLCLGRSRVAADMRIRQAVSWTVSGPYHKNRLGLANGPLYAHVYALHNSNSHVYPGGNLSAETEAIFKQFWWTIANGSSVYFDRDLADFRRVHNTENNAVTGGFVAWYLMLGYLKGDPIYTDTITLGGKTVMEYYDLWNTYMKNWLRSRALNGMWVELGSGYLGDYTLTGIYALREGAADSEVRQLATMLIDLTYIDDAQCSFGDIRGGSRSRIKTQGIWGPMGVDNSFWYDGSFQFSPKGHILASSTYEVAEVAALIHNFEQFPTTPVEIINRRLGETRDVELSLPRPYNEDPHMVNYIYKTQYYMLGSTNRAPRITTSAGFAQCQWNGLNFFDGLGLFPTSNNALDYYAIQVENVWLMHLLKERHIMEMWISGPLNLEEDDGWVFINNDDKAYAALKGVNHVGSYKWESRPLTYTSNPQGKILPGTILDLPEASSPYVVEAGDVDEHGSFANFKSSVKASNINYEHRPDGGATLNIFKNAWKMIDYPYLVTVDTILEFDFKATVKVEIQGIGFDNDESPASGDKIFNLYGTQRGGFGITTFEYTSAGMYQHFVVDVGSYFTGPMSYLVFMCDDDALGGGDAYFKNVKVYEAGDVATRIDFNSHTIKSYSSQDRGDDGIHSLTYSANGRSTIELFYEGTGLFPRVDGVPISFDRELVYDSPFMQRHKGSNVVAVSAHGVNVNYNFDTASVETIDSKPSAAPSQSPVHKVYFGDGEGCILERNGFQCPIWHNIFPGDLGAPGHSSGSGGISGTSAPFAYGGHIFLPFSYKLELNPGNRYEVILGFAETWGPNCAKDQRVFNVAVGDQTELDVDVFTRAGSKCYNAYDLTFSDVQPNESGEVFVTLTSGVREQPFLSVLLVYEM